MPLAYETLIIDDPDEPARPFPPPDPATPTTPSPPETIPGPTVVTLARRSLAALAGRQHLDELRFRGPRVPMSVHDDLGVRR
jgi:hypothetical protein